MEPNTQGQSGGGSSQGKVFTGGVVVDKNKSQEQYMADVEGKFIVPQLIREKFPDLVKLIFETESMNEEEREYWLQIMPIMTEDQIVKFREILVNEKNQLEKLDKEYEQEVSKIDNKYSPQIDEEALKNRLNEIKEREKAQESSEKAEEEELLSQLENMDV